MVSGRYLFAFPAAAITTVGLFFLMRALVTSDSAPVLEEMQSVAISITRSDRLEDVNARERQLMRPERQEAPPPPPPAALKPQSRPDLKNMAIPVSGLGLNLDLSVGAPQDRNVQPKIRVPPQYPSRALSRGIEGWVELEFSVNEQGDVMDPRVIRADPEGIFDRAALRAVRKFKYNPRLVNGEPVRQQGIRFMFQFRIED